VSGSRLRTARRAGHELRSSRSRREPEHRSPDQPPVHGGAAEDPQIGALPGGLEVAVIGVTRAPSRALMPNGETPVAVGALWSSHDG
jgi:hypothetical protein